MHVTLFAAVSTNGCIATSGGSEEFLSDDHWTIFCSFAQEIGCTIRGRTTYDVVSTWEQYTLDDVPAKLKIILSQTKTDIPGFTVARSPREALDIAAKAGFSSVLVAGGCMVNTAFLAENLVDTLMLSVEPVLVAEGIPYARVEKRLSLERASSIGELAQLRFRVEK